MRRQPSQSPMRPSSGVSGVGRVVKEDDYDGEDDGRSQFGRGSSGPCPKCPSRVTLHFPQQISGDVDVNFSTDVEGVVTVAIAMPKAMPTAAAAMPQFDSSSVAKGRARAALRNPSRRPLQAPPKGNPAPRVSKSLLPLRCPSQSLARSQFSLLRRLNADA